MENYSVLMSLYKQEKANYLAQALDSMLCQTIPPEEIVLVLDGPITKELCQVVSKYKEEYPDVMNIIVSYENLGLGMALNLGLQNCRNELVARMDTDDISKPYRCEVQLKEFERNPELALLGSSIEEFYDDISTIISRRDVPLSQKDIYKFGKRRSAFNHPTVMYKKSKVLEAGGYSDLRRNQDVDLFGRMLFQGSVASNIMEPLVWFRCGKELAKRRRSWENTKSYINTIKKFWKMGYAGFFDYMIVASAQTIMFLCPLKIQQWIYRIFLRNNRKREKYIEFRAENKLSIKQVPSHKKDY